MIGRLITTRIASLAILQAGLSRSWAYCLSKNLYILQNAELGIMTCTCLHPHDLANFQRLRS